MPFDIEQRRRISDFEQALRVIGIGQRNQMVVGLVKPIQGRRDTVCIKALRDELGYSGRYMQLERADAGCVDLFGAAQCGEQGTVLFGA